MSSEKMKRYWFIAFVVSVCIVGFFSVLSLFVSHERESLVRAVEAGSGPARLLIQAANFWDRYFLFCTIALVAALHGWRRLLNRTVGS